MFSMTAYKDDKQGTWYVKFSYVDWTGSRRWTTKRGFSSKRKAERYEAEKKKLALEQSDITVNQLIDAYLDDKKISLRANSYRSRETILNSYVRPYLGKLRLTQLTPLKMRQWQHNIITMPGTKGTQLKQSSVVAIHTVASTMLNYAVKFYGLPQNPLSIIGRPKIQQKYDRPSGRHIWELEDFQKAMRYVDDLATRCTLEILFYGGLRIGELKALDVSDFDFDKGTVSITKSYDPLLKKISCTKTASSVRVINMPATVMEHIKDFISRSCPVPSPIISFNEVTIRRKIKALAKKADVPSIRVHDLRHSHASYLIHRGIPITTISRRLGHKNPSITMAVYSHMYHNADSDLAQLMENDIAKTDNNEKT